MQLSTLSCLSVVLAIVASSDAADTNLRHVLESKGQANIFVKMKQQPTEVINTYVRPMAGTRGEKINALRSALKAQAQTSQTPVFDRLSSRVNLFSGRSRSFWITNQVYIEGATADLIEELEALPNVAEIHQEKVFEREPMDVSQVQDTGMRSVPEWGLERLGVPDLWSEDNCGNEIVVGTIDTGVQYQHEALKDNFVGFERHGWFDGAPWRPKLEPFDDDGHGTHTMGTIVGHGGIGVAPNAKWMTCAGCNKFGCAEHSLLACGEFMTCPTDVHGKNANCDFAPHIISSSWGAGRANDFFDDVIATWREAGIIPVFAIGNDGKEGCGTGMSPGDHEDVIAVGATTVNDTLAKYSSRGPSARDGISIKPDVVAPGSKIRSAWISKNSNTLYNTISGTSMACPHVSGTIALILEAHPDADYDFVYEALTGTTITDELDGSDTCEGVANPGFPNNFYGNGLINAYESCHYDN